MNTKEEILNRVRELLESENFAARMDQEIIDDLKNEKLISFFEKLKSEEHEHAKIVSGLIKILEG